MKNEEYQEHLLLSNVSSPPLNIVHFGDNTVCLCTSAINSLLKVLLLQVYRLIDNFQGWRTRVYSVVRKFNLGQTKGVQSLVNKKSNEESKQIALEIRSVGSQI